jgi:Zn-dependent protease with chaperone function
VTTTWVLLGVVVVAGYLAPAVLAGARWPQRVPKLGAIAWLTTALVCAWAAVLAIATVAIPTAVAGHGLADWWNACLSQWRHYYGNASPAEIGTAGGVTVILIGSVVWSAIRHHRRVRGIRRNQRAGLTLLNGTIERGVVVLPHPTPAAYCVPGRPGRVVLTAGAIRALAPDQINAIVAHERAHLDGRHATLLAVAAVLRTSMGWLAPVFRRASREVAALTEMSADDSATVTCPPHRVADALLTLAGGVVPDATLAAGEPPLATRISRLLLPSHPVSPAKRRLILASLCLFLAMPAVVVIEPTVSAVIAATCTHESH